MELTQEQIEAVRKFTDHIVDTFRRFCEAVKRMLEKIKVHFNKCILEMEPRKRYKLLKSIGIRHYEPFFRRKGVIHCRNNC